MELKSVGVQLFKVGNFTLESTVKREEVKEPVGDALIKKEMERGNFKFPLLQANHLVCYVAYKLRKKNEK